MELGEATQIQASRTEVMFTGQITSQLVAQLVGLTMF